MRLVAMAMTLGLWSLGATAGSPSWEEVAKWPDLTGGEWVIKGSLVNTLGARDAPLKPDARANLPQRPGTATDGCAPRGMPSLVGGEFFYAKDSILLVVDFDYLVFRRIFMDGRSHAAADPTYFGHSVGHWEGRTLVVDTAALLPEVPLAGVSGHGSATRIVERFEPVDAKTLHLKLTVTNPDLLTGPWQMDKTLVRLPDLEVREAFCQQNDRNAPVDGKDHIDLRPPQRDSP